MHADRTVDVVDAPSGAPTTYIIRRQIGTTGGIIITNAEVLHVVLLPTLVFPLAAAPERRADGGEQGHG